MTPDRETSDAEPIVAVVGPTATGKSDLALDLAAQPAQLGGKHVELFLVDAEQPDVVPLAAERPGHRPAHPGAGPDHHDHPVAHAASLGVVGHDVVDARVEA